MILLKALTIRSVIVFFATGENKQIINENLKSFYKEKGATWILKLVN